MQYPDLDTPISPLRQRLIDDMNMRRFSRETQCNYLRDIGRLAIFLGRSPDTATADELRQFRIEQQEDGVPVPTMNSIVSALRFFFNQTLDRPDLARRLVRLAHPRNLPVVLSRYEVARLLDATTCLKHQAALSVAYGAEILIPICSPKYREEHGSVEGIKRTPDTTINFSDTFPNLVSLFSPAEGEVINSMIFSDYAVVVQAALLGQGVALGWLNVVAHWLRTEALVPAREQLMMPGRQCHLVRLRDKPLRPIVAQVRDWIISEMHADVAAVDALYPALKLNSEVWAKTL